MNLKNLPAYMRTVRISFEMQLRQNFSDAFIIFAIIVQPMIIAMLALWMLRDQVDQFAIFVVVGSGMTGLWSSLQRARWASRYCSSVRCLSCPRR